MAVKKVFEVSLKKGHPTGTYRRGGHVFRASAPTILETVPELVKKDPWLMIKAVEAPKGKEELNH